MPGSSEDRLPSQGRRPSRKRKLRKDTKTYTSDHPTHEERAEVHRIVRNPPKSVQRAREAAAGVGKSTVRGARAVRAGADAGPIHRALTEPRPRHRRGGILGGIEEGFGRAEDFYGGLGEAAYTGGKKRALKIVAPTVGNVAPGLADRLPRPYTGEELSEGLVGKAATNRVLHGDRGHNIEAGLEIASLLPFLKGPKALVGLVRGARGVEEAGLVGTEAGHAVSIGAPLGRKAAPITRNANKVGDVLDSAAAARAEQEAGYSVERAKRFKNAGKEFGQAGGGLAGHRAAKGQLKGELPKVDFSRLREGGYTPEELDRDIDMIYEHPELRQGEKTSAADALEGMALRGAVPQKKQIKLLGTVFGPEEALKLSRLTLGDHIVEVLNIARTLMATADVSAPFRQGLVAFARHPVLGAKGLPKMFKYLFSEDQYQGLLKTIHADPEYGKAERAGLNLTELGGSLGTREEGYIAEGVIAKPLPVKGHNVNLPGRVVHASGRAYTGFLDYMRFAMFKEQLRLARKAGVNVNSPREVRAIANFVNNATGRGDFGPIESWAPFLNAVFFSPRLAATRGNMLGLTDIAAAFAGKKGFYGNLTPYARRQAVRSMVQLGAAGSAALAAGAYLLNGKVALDPRSSDFAKLKMGDTRVDVLGGFQQYVRVVSQLVSGEKIDSQGNVVKLEPGIGHTSRYDVAMNFLQGKGSPTTTLLIDALKGTAFGNQPLTVQHEIATRLIPLVAQDAWDLYKNKHDVKLALIGFGVASFGAGVQTYEDATVKKQRQDLKDWHSKADKVWERLYKVPMPMTVVRAKQDQIAVNALTRDAGDDRERISILADYIVKNRPQLAQYEADYKGLAPTPGNVKILRDLIYGRVLSQVTTQLSANGVK